MFGARVGCSLYIFFSRMIFLGIAYRLQQECGELGPGSVSPPAEKCRSSYFDPPLDRPGPVGSRWSRSSPKFEKVSKQAV